MGSEPDLALYKKSTKFRNKTVTIFLHNKVTDHLQIEMTSEVLYAGYSEMVSTA